MVELWQALTGGAIVSGLAGILVQVFIPKRRDKLDRADVLTDNALQIAERASVDAKEARERAEQAERKIDVLGREVADLRTENDQLRRHLRAFMEAWKKRLPGQPLPVDVAAYFAE